MKTCLLIYNLESGKGINKKNIAEMILTLEKNNYQVTKVITKRPGDATKIVKKTKYVDLIISVGGDGTFNEVVTGNYQRDNKILLSHIPIGTTNDIGTMWGLKKNNIINNLKDILNGEIKKIDICTINNKPFIYVAGFGKFMNVTYETPKKTKKILGYLAYIKGGVKEFFKKSPLFEIEYEINGEKFHGLYSIILISNANRIAGFNNFYYDIKLDDNKFEVLLSNLTTKKDMLKTAAYMQNNDVTKIPGFYCYKTNNFKLHFIDLPKKPWTIDGEKFESNTKEYNISFTKDIKMLIPKKNIKKLFLN